MQCECGAAMIEETGEVMKCVTCGEETSGDEVCSCGEKLVETLKQNGIEYTSERWLCPKCGRRLDAGSVAPPDRGFYTCSACGGSMVRETGDLQGRSIGEWNALAEENERLKDQLNAFVAGHLPELSITICTDQGSRLLPEEFEHIKKEIERQFAEIFDNHTELREENERLKKTEHITDLKEHLKVCDSGSFEHLDDLYVGECAKCKAKLLVQKPDPPKCLELPIVEENERLKTELRMRENINKEQGMLLDEYIRVFGKPDEAIPERGHWTREPPTKGGWYSIAIPATCYCVSKLHDHKEEWIVKLALVRWNGQRLVYDCHGWAQSVAVEGSTGNGEYSVLWWSEPERLPAPPKED
jgi:hypothetical protein